METRALTLIMGAACAAASAAMPIDINWESQDPVEAYRAAAAQEGAGAAPRSPEKGKDKKPPIKYDTLRLPLFYTELLGVSGQLVGRAVLDPYIGLPDASNSSSVRYPLVYVYYIQQPPVPMERPIVFGLYVVGEDEMQMLQRMPGYEIPMNRLVGFAADGVRYLYLLTSKKPEERALAEQYADEMDRTIHENEVIRLSGMEYQAKSQFDFWLDQYFSSERRSAEGEARARENPWWKKEGLDQETLERLTTRYEFKTLADVDGDGKAELLVYSSDPERLDERRTFKRASEPSHKWNTLFIGLEILDGHREHADRIHLGHEGKLYCARAPVGGWWHEPFTEGFGSRIVLVSQGYPQASPVGGPWGNAILLIGKDGSSKAIFALRTFREAPHRMIHTEVKDLDAAATAEVLAGARSSEDLSKHVRRGELRSPRMTYGNGVAAKSPR